MSRFSGHQHSSNAVDDDDDEIGTGQYRIPDKDVYRRMITSFGTVQNFFQDRLYTRTARDRLLLQPHFTSLKRLVSPFGCQYSPADGICAHFLRRGLIKPQRTQMTRAVWSADARWLVLGTVQGGVAIWEADTLKIHKFATLASHVDAPDGENVRKHFEITSIAWNNHSNVLVSGDERGMIQITDETFRFATAFEGHNGAVRGLSYSPLDNRLVSCGDDHLLNIWAVGRDSSSPKDRTLAGHQSDVKCVDWHPYRALIASGSRDTSVRLWDPRQATTVSTLLGHKKQVNCLGWNKNGNWLASGSKDGLVKVYDIRAMKEMEIYRGHNCDVCSLGWHPHHETTLLTGGYNGSLIYWLVNHNQAPHTIIAGAHRQSIDIIAWHPAGHLVGTASHDAILKFWCREPPGSTLEPDPREMRETIGQGDDPVYAHGPLEVGAQNIVPVLERPGGAPFGVGGGVVGAGGGGGVYGEGGGGWRGGGGRGERGRGGGGDYHGGGQGTGGGRGGGRGGYRDRGADQDQPVSKAPYQRSGSRFSPREPQQQEGGVGVGVSWSSAPSSSHPGPTGPNGPSSFATSAIGGASLDSSYSGLSGPGGRGSGGATGGERGFGAGGGRGAPLGRKRAGDFF